jgi:hypothetical protein
MKQKKREKDGTNLSKLNQSKGLFGCCSLQNYSIKNGNAQGKASVRSDTASWAYAHYQANKPASTSVRLSHLSQKYLPTRSLNACLTASCGRQPTPSPHSPQRPSPPRTLILHCSLLAPARRVPQPCLSFLAPIVPPAACPPAPSSEPLAFVGAGGALARLRSVPT